MRRAFNLDLATSQLERGIFLLHGGYAAGKTHLLGDALRYYSTKGAVRFLNVQGEDGYLSAQSFDLGNIGETAETYDDLITALTDYKKAGVMAVGIDSMKAAVKLVMTEVLGTADRMPSVGGNKNEWGDVHFKMENFINRARNAAPFVICVCPSDKSVNQLDGKTYVTPDLPGRQAAGSAGWFDFVGYVWSDVISEGVIQRKVRFAPNNQILTRQRLPRPLTSDIVLPEGGGGWEKIITAFNQLLMGSTKSGKSTVVVAGTLR